MNFGFTEEQELLRQEARKFLDENCPLEEVRKISEERGGFSPELWKQIAELGWLGLTIPEEHGGVGLGFVDLTVLLEETGRTLFPSPFVSSTLVATTIAQAGSDAQKKEWLPRFADGSAIGAFAVLEASDTLAAGGIRLEGRAENDGFVLSGEKTVVPDGGVATVFLVPFRSGSGEEEISLALIERDAPGVDVETLPTMDLTKAMGRLRLEDVRVESSALLGGPGAAWPMVERILDTGAMAVTAEVVGAAEAALQLTVDYAKDRIQFDQPIGKYQGVKHPLAEMYVDVESVKSLVYYAAWALDRDHEDVPRAVSRAKAYATDAFARIGIDVVQLHGGIGYTWEYDAQLYLKRAKWARPIYGDADWHYERLVRLGGL